MIVVMATFEKEDGSRFEKKFEVINEDIDYTVNHIKKYAEKNGYKLCNCYSRIDR